jgi:hypothetical protein
MGQPWFTAHENGLKDQCHAAGKFASPCLVKNKSPIDAILQTSQLIITSRQ